MEIPNVFPWILAAFGGSTVVSVGLSTWLGSLPANRLLQAHRHRFDVELERLKANLDSNLRWVQAVVDRTAFVHRVEFEAEFKAMTDVWAQVVEVRDRMGLVRPEADFVPVDDTAEEAEKRFMARRQKFKEGLNLLIEPTYRTGPFLPERVFSCLDEMLRIAKLELVEVSTERPEQVRDWFSRGKMHLDAFSERADELSRLIRARLHEVSVIELPKETEQTMALRPNS